MSTYTSNRKKNNVVQTCFVKNLVCVALRSSFPFSSAGGGVVLQITIGNSPSFFLALKVVIMFKNSMNKSLA